MSRLTQARFGTHAASLVGPPTLLEAGVNLRLIQEWLGHNSPATTSVYTHLTVKAEQLGTKASKAIDQLMSDL